MQNWCTIHVKKILFYSIIMEFIHHISLHVCKNLFWFQSKKSGLSVSPDCGPNQMTEVSGVRLSVILHIYISRRHCKAVQQINMSYSELRTTDLLISELSLQDLARGNQLKTAARQVFFLKSVSSHR